MIAEKILCSEGNEASIKFKCGHSICISCACEQREEVLKRVRKYITCEQCGGLPGIMDTIKLGCGCTTNDLGITGAYLKKNSN